MIRTELLELLRSPDDGTRLGQPAPQVLRSETGIEYAVEDGIPLLYPRSVDAHHLEEEGHLAEMMQRAPESPADAFSFEQWRRSKQEVWEVIRQAVGERAGPQRIVYIGCGLDVHAHEFEPGGHLFVNFDLIPAMLQEQRTASASKSCVAGDINALPFAPQSFDIVVCIDVVHHEYGRLAEVLRDIVGLLKPDGLLFLEDPNAWALFQMHKTALLPKPVYRVLRSWYHGLKRSCHRPADYEFPTSAAAVKKALEREGMVESRVYQLYSYPELSPRLYPLFGMLARSRYVAAHHNFHYLLSARRANNTAAAMPGRVGE